MLKSILVALVIINTCLWGKVQTDIYFSRYDRDLTELKPIVEADRLFNTGEVIYFYIYSTKKFNTDTLYIMLVNIDNKPVILPKAEIGQTLILDVDPEATAARGKIVVHKEGQYLVRVFNPSIVDKPLVQAELLLQ